MNERRWLVLGLTLAVTLLPACRNKNPTTAPEAAPAPAAATAPAAPAGTNAAGQQLDPLAGDLDAVNEYVRRQGLLGTVYFDYDRSELRSDAREQLTKNADFLRRHPQFVVAIEGHGDERGTNAYNLALGERRAGATREFLSGLGVGAQRLRTISYGEERPTCAEPSETCWRRNRRAEFVVVGRTTLG